MKECIAYNFDIFLMGVVLGALLIKATEIFTEWSRIKVLNNEIKLHLKLGESLIKMQEKINE